MNKSSALILVMSVVFTTAGLAGGWFAATQTHSAPAGHEGHGEEDEHAGHDHGPAKPKLSPQAIRNLGITVAPAQPTTFTKYQAIPAAVADTPATHQPVFAPFGGRVQAIAAPFGSVVNAGTVVMTVVRDPLPRPDLTTMEEIHTAIAELRKTSRQVDILNTEIKRISEFMESGTQDGLPLLPKKGLLDLQYELSRAEQDLQSTYAELLRHGVSQEEIADIEAVKPGVDKQESWSEAMRHHGYWPRLADSVFDVLPDDARHSPWVAATVCELIISGLVSDGFADWLREHPEAGRHLLDIGSLLQQGRGLPDIQLLLEQGALDMRIEIRAPMTAPDWDVVEIHVKAGQKVEAGDSLMILSNPRDMYLRVDPVGGETAAMLKALAMNDEVEAHPLVPGIGPVLTGLRIVNMLSSEETRGNVAYLRLRNEPLAIVTGAGDVPFRTWQLREGQKYMLRIPTEKMDGVYVLPGDAIADDGPDKVAFIQDGDHFKAVKVAVLYQDQEVAVLDKTSEVFPGDPLVQHGALGLGLALKAGSGAVDPHAGHNH